MFDLLPKYSIRSILLLLVSLGNIQCNKIYVLDEFPTIHFLHIPTNTKSNLKSIAFLNDKEGFAAGDSGKILHSTDGGDSWSDINFVSTGDILKIVPLSSDTVWIGTTKGMYRTTDGGTTWSSNKVPFNSPGKVLDICFTGQTGYACSADDYSGEFYKTTNRGDNWTTIVIGQVNLGPHLITMHFFNKDTGYAAGADGCFIATYNGGVNWTQTDNMGSNYAVDPDYKKIIFRSPTDGLIAGEDGILLKATGIPKGNYTDKDLKPFDWHRHLYGVALRGNRAIAVGSAAVLTYVPELSKSGRWSDMLTPEGESFHGVYLDVTFINDNTAIAVGLNGLMTKFFLK